MYHSAQLSLLRDSRGKALAVLHDKERESEAMDYCRVVENLLVENTQLRESDPLQGVEVFFSRRVIHTDVFPELPNFFLIDRVYLRSEIVILTFQIHETFMRLLVC